MVVYCFVFPVLFSIGKLAVSSFGVFLSLGFLTALFLIWRLARAWDLEEERVLDLTLLTFLGGLLGARIYYVFEHLSLFAVNFLRLLEINKYPGFSFWGSFLGGWLTLFFLTRSKKMDFWQISDFVSIGFLGSLILSDLGCFLGGCEIGVKSNLFFAMEMVGFLGKRFPVQIVEALLLLWVLIKLWSQAIRFHTRGKILSLTLIYIGLIKFLTGFLKQSGSQGQFLTVALLFLGMVILYRVTKRSFSSDLKNLPRLLLSLDGLKKYWYNQTTSFLWKIKNFKRIIRRMNVRISYKNNKPY